MKNQQFEEFFEKQVFIHEGVIIIQSPQRNLTLSVKINPHATDKLEKARKEALKFYNAINRKR